MKASLMAIFFVYSNLLFAQESIDGFRDWKWGKPLSELESNLQPSKNKMPTMKSYELIKGEELVFEGVEVRLISYGFKKGKFEMVSIGVFRKDIDQLVEALSKKYGEAKKTDTPFLVNYEWHPDGADMSLTDFPAGKESTAIGIRKAK